MKRSVFFWKTIIETFQWRRKLQFWQACWKLSPKVLKISAQHLKTKKTWVSFQKKLFKTYIWSHRMQSWRPCGTFSAKPLKLFNFEVTKLNKRTTFTEKKILVKLFTRTREMQCDQPCWNDFAKFLEKIGWISKTISQDMNTFFFRKSFFFSKCSFGHPDCIFDEQAAYLPPEVG